VTRVGNEVGIHITCLVIFHSDWSSGSRLSKLFKHTGVNTVFRYNNSIVRILLWPARVTTKISLAAPRHHLGNVCRMGVPERGGGQKAADCLDYLATQPLPYKENTNTYYNLHFTTNMK